MTEAKVEEKIDSSDLVLFGYTTKDRLTAALIISVFIPLIINFLSYYASVNYESNSNLNRSNRIVPVNTDQITVMQTPDHIGINNIKMKTNNLILHGVSRESLVLPDELLYSLNNLIHEEQIKYEDIEWLLTLHEVTLAQFSNATTSEDAMDFYNLAIEINQRLENFINIAEA